MKLEQLVDKISTLRLKMWPESDTLNIVEFDHLVATLTEELGELRQSVRSYLGRPYSPEKAAYRSHLVEELGDTLVPIVSISRQLDISFVEALDFAHNKLNDRYEKKCRIESLIKQDEKPVGKFSAELHQPLKYDLEDPINNQ
jgi:NTP pyrophosphatase (non-canonical NTP hydrolase)